MPSICPGQKWENKGNPSKPWVSQSLGQGRKRSSLPLSPSKVLPFRQAEKKNGRDEKQSPP